MFKDEMEHGAQGGILGHCEIRNAYRTPFKRATISYAAGTPPRPWLILVRIHSSIDKEFLISLSIILLFLYGGKSKSESEYTYEWLPDISVPRLFTVPFNFFLAAREVIANYYPSKYRSVKTDELWKRVATKAEMDMWKAFFEKCASKMPSTHTDECVYDQMTY